MKKTTSYMTKTVKCVMNGKEIFLIHKTPEYDETEREVLRKEIEQGLYDIFKKY